MTTPQIEVLLIAIVTALSCSLPGVFMLLRRQAMASDAISHSILFGIVIAFLIVKDISSPFLIVGAALTGVLTVFLVEIIVNTGLLREDASIGLVFPFLFSLGVILIAKKAGNVHLDTDAVLLGEIAFAPFERLEVGGMDLGPKAMYVMGTIFLLNLVFIALFFKELKITTFDPGLANSLGFPSRVFHYGLMGLASLTAVGAFDAVGAVLVVALMVVPPACAYLLVNRLGLMIYVSLIIALFCSTAGFFTATYIDVSVAGTMAVTLGVVFTLILFFAPPRGLIFVYLKRSKSKLDLAHTMLLVHIANHERSEEKHKENHIKHIHKHLNWESSHTTKVIALALNRGSVVNDANILFLSPEGKEIVKNAMQYTGKNSLIK